MATKRKTKFRDEYTKEFPSIKRGRVEYEAECKLCNCNFSISHGGKSDIRTHINTAKHKKALSSASSSKQLMNIFIADKSEERKVAAAEATFVFHSAWPNMSSTNGSKCEETYCKDWEEQEDLKDWLRPVAGDEGKVSCRFCECEMLAHYSVLQQHMATTRHKKRASPSASTSITDAGLNASKPSGMTTSRIKLLTDGICPALNALATAPKTNEGQPHGVMMDSKPRTAGETFHFSTKPTLEDIRNLQCAFAAERGWGKYHQPRNLLLALVGEVGELAELFQWREEVPEGLPGWTTSEREALSDELSDVLIYLVALADKCRVDLPSAVLRKMEKNCLKYPAKQVYGSSKKYTEYQK